MFRDTAPQHSAQNPTRAECDAADEAAAQERAAAAGAACYALAEALTVELDRYHHVWRADDKALIDQIFNLLAEAQAITERLT